MWFGFGNDRRRDPPQNRTETPAQEVAWFGKLPTHADFIRHNVSGREIKSFENWVQDGVALMIRNHGEQWSSRLSGLRTLGFLHVGSEDSHTLAGVVMPSRDRSGRSYPFSLVVSRHLPLLQEMQGLAPMACAELIAALDEAVQGLRHVQSRDGIQVLGERLAQVECERDRHRAIREVMARFEQRRLGELWAGLPGMQDPAARSALVAAIGSTLRGIARRGMGRVRWGLRFPLPAGAPAVDFIQFWMQLAVSFLGDQGWNAWLYWAHPEDDRPGMLCLLFHTPPPSYLAALVEPERDDGSMLDLLAESRQEMYAESPVHEALLRDEPTLMEALNLWRVQGEGRP